MRILRVQAIVEGHGEVDALPILLRRMAAELYEAHFDVLRPIRQPKHALVHKPDTLQRSVGIAANKLAAAGRPAGHINLILLLVDADEDRPCELGPSFLNQLQLIRSDISCACVIANVEFETWFIACAASLQGYLDLSETDPLPDDPEGHRLGKNWIKSRFNGAYKETVDQPKLTAQMDLIACRHNSPSFDKLCRDIEAHLDAVD